MVGSQTPVSELKRARKLFRSFTAGSTHSMVVICVDHHRSCHSGGRAPAPPTPLLHVDVSVCGCWIRSLFLSSFPNLVPVQSLCSLGVVGEIVADLFHHLFFHLQVSWCWSHKLHFLLVFLHISTAVSQTRENTLNHPKSLYFPKLLQVRLKVKDCIIKLLQPYFEGRYLRNASNQIYKRPSGQSYSQ